MIDDDNFVDQKNKTRIINLIKVLPEKRDNRSSKFIQDKFKDDKFVLLEYLNDRIKEIVCCSEDKYKICILDTNHMIYFSEDAKGVPVPTGFWMDWWEKDQQNYFGVILQQYKKMSRKDRALLECKLQFKKGYPKVEFFSLYAEFYYPIEYDAWWWNDKIDISEKQGIKKEEYWKEKFFEKEKLLEKEKFFEKEKLKTRFKWQTKAIDLAKELELLLKEYEVRKSKFIKYAPTDKELREAIEMYKFLLDDADKGIESSIRLLDIFNSITDNTEEQIKLFGFIDETLKQYPDGKIPRDFMLDKAEKWGVLDYIVEDIVRVLGIKFRK